MVITEEMLVIAFGVLLILLVLWFIRIELRIARLLRGNGVTSIEDSIRTLGRETDTLMEFREEVTKYLTLAETRMRRSIQGIGTVRFNPFKGTGDGGNQSFATAFLDEDGNGIVISTLYSRERVGVYAKPIERFVSSFELTSEEKEAIAKAKR